MEKDRPARKYRTPIKKQNIEKNQLVCSVVHCSLFFPVFLAIRFGLSGLSSELACIPGWVHKVPDLLQRPSLASMWSRGPCFFGSPKCRSFVWGVSVFHSRVFWTVMQSRL